MKRTKKYLNTFGLCAVSVAVLMGCQTQNDEEIYFEQDTYVQENVNVSAPSEVPFADNQFAGEQFTDEQLANEQQAVVNPYEDIEIAIEEPAVQETVAPCYQVKDGQVAGTAQNVTHKESNPCSLNKATSAQTEDGEKLAAAKTFAASNTMVNIETPARCQIIDKDNSIISSIALSHSDFEMIRMDKSDALPRYEVNDYTFKNMPLDLAIQNLVSEADIRVFSDDALFPEISGDNIRGELTAVMNELTAAGDVFYRYNAAKKQLILSRWARFTMKVPGGRIGMYTVLDALRGANITNLQPDFGANEIYMRINTEKQKVVMDLIEAIKQSKDLLLFDIQVYRLVSANPNTQLNWQDIVQRYGVSKINSSVNGIMGRILTNPNQPANQKLVDVLRGYGSVNLISEGVAVMPNGWKVRFDIGQCTNFETPEQNLSMLFQSNILSASRAESNIALDTPKGEITSFHTLYNIDDTLNIIGVPGKVFNPEWGNSIEYIITLKPRLVRLVK